MTYPLQWATKDNCAQKNTTKKQKLTERLALKDFGSTLCNNGTRGRRKGDEPGGLKFWKKYYYHLNNDDWWWNIGLKYWLIFKVCSAHCPVQRNVLLQFWHLGAGVACTLHIEHCTVQIIHCTFAHCTFAHRTFAHCTLHIAYFISHIGNMTLHIEHRTVHITHLQITHLHIARCTLGVEHCIFHIAYWHCNIAHLHI